jgi:hypothetical protein
METKQVLQPASKESQMKFTLANLADEDARLRRPILEAASVAARLSLDPGDHNLRERASKAWARIDSVIARHLGKEQRTVLPWADSLAEFPRQLVDRARKKHEQIMALRDLIVTHSFMKGRRGSGRRGTQPVRLRDHARRPHRRRGTRAVPGDAPGVVSSLPNLTRAAATKGEGV